MSTRSYDLGLWTQPKYAALMDSRPSNFIPPGLVDENYVAPDKSEVLLVFSLVTIVVLLVSVGGRIWARTAVTIAWAVEDYMLVVAAVGLFSGIVWGDTIGLMLTDHEYRPSRWDSQ